MIQRNRMILRLTNVPLGIKVNPDENSGGHVAGAYPEVRSESLDENRREAASDRRGRVEESEEHRSQVRVENAEARLQREHGQRSS